MNWKRIFAVLCILRILNGITVRTYFDPDEYWQSLEVACCLSFGRCHLTWEWQKGVQLRSFFHPFLFACLYSFFAACGIDSRNAVAYGPRLLSGLMAGVGDVSIFALGLKLMGLRGASWALFANLFNWFYFYAAVRTYSNSAEAVFTIAALSYWPFHKSDTAGRKRALTLAACAVLMRPTAAAFWLYPGLRHLIALSGVKEQARFIFAEVLPIGVVALIVMLLSDKQGYGEWTFVPFNFVRVNLIEGVGEEYGVHNTMWYVSECLPAVMGLWLVPLMYGIWHAVQYRTRVRLLVEYLAWGTFVLSLSPHKELRFALPLLPIASVVVGYGLMQVEPSIRPNDKHPPLVGIRHFRTFLALTVAANVLVGGYLSLFHQRAPIQVMEFLSLAGTNATFVDFYTRCHATPFTSHVHATSIERLRFLDCSPQVEALRSIPSMSMSLVHGVEEEDLFFADPVKFLKHRFREGESIPSHLVFTTEKVSYDVIEWVGKVFYFEHCATFHHTPWISFVVLRRIG